MKYSNFCRKFRLIKQCCWRKSRIDAKAKTSLRRCGQGHMTLNTNANDKTFPECQPVVFVTQWSLHFCCVMVCTETTEYITMRHCLKRRCENISSTSLPERETRLVISTNNKVKLIKCVAKQTIIMSTCTHHDSRRALILSVAKGK